MRASRRVIRQSYIEGESEEEDYEWAPSTSAAPRGHPLEPLGHFADGERHGSRESSAEAAALGASGAAGCGGSGGGGSGSLTAGVLEDWEEELLASLSPDSQKRERRRIQNRDCARRIRQRKTELLSELTVSKEQLQAEHTRLLATLTEVTRCWRDTTIENCELRAQLTLLHAGGSGGSRTSGGTGGDSGLPSPVGLPAQLGSPGWPSPMLL